MENGKFKDAGRLERDYSNESVSSSKKAEKPKTKIVYSRVNVDAKNFPYLRSVKVGDECKLIVKVKKVAEAEPDNYEVDKDNKITLEILKIAEPEDEYESLTKEKSE